MIKHAACSDRKQTPEYSTWASMKDRCYNKNRPNYFRWGGRGIRVCKQWRESFEIFLAYIGKRPSPDHQLDRIDNARHYEPGNVRWATRKEQQRNLRSNHFVTIDGETKTIAEWCEKLSVGRNVILLREKRRTLESLSGGKRSNG